MAPGFVPCGASGFGCLYIWPIFVLTLKFVIYIKLYKCWVSAVTNTSTADLLPVLSLQKSHDSNPNIKSSDKSIIFINSENKLNVWINILTAKRDASRESKFGLKTRMRIHCRHSTPSTRRWDNNTDIESKTEISTNESNDWDLRYALNESNVIQSTVAVVLNQSTERNGQPGNALAQHWHSAGTPLAYH